MNCKLNYKIGIVLVVLILVLVITIKKQKVSEKFNLFRNDDYIRSQLANHEILLKQQRRNQHMSEMEENQQNTVNENKDIIYNLRQRFLLLQQLF